MSDIEGAICDNCGATIGPGGCCATHAARADELEQLREERDRLRLALWKIEQGSKWLALTQAQYRVALMKVNNIAREALETGA